MIYKANALILVSFCAIMYLIPNNYNIIINHITIKSGQIIGYFMNNKLTIAQNHGVDINKYQSRNIIVKDTSFFNIFAEIFMFILSLFFLVIAILNKDKTFILIFLLSLSVITFFASIAAFIDTISFKIAFTNGTICYRRFLQKLNFFVTNIQYFTVESDHLSRYYTILIFLNNNVIKYRISQNNKENFIFLLNLLKSGIEQKLL